MRTTGIVASLVTVAVLAMLAAGCGGSGSAGVASVSSTTTTATTGTEQGAAVAFARCMRAHGIPNWPDPGTNGVFDKSKLRQLGISPTRLRAIQDHSCGHFLPGNGSPPQLTPQQQRTRLADGLSFARCMRSRGVGRFPDPTATGDLTVEMVQAQGIDVHSPAVLRIVQACLPASHGALTPAKIREALNNAGK